MVIRSIGGRALGLAAILVLICAFLVTLAGRATAGGCGGGPAWVYLGEGYHEIRATTDVLGTQGDGKQGYRVLNGSDSNLSVQVRGFELRPPAESSSILTTPPREPVREKWVGVPVGPNGAVEASVDWGDVGATPAIRVMNLGGRPAASVSFEC